MQETVKQLSLNLLKWFALVLVLVLVLVASVLSYFYSNTTAAVLPVYKAVFGGQELVPTASEWFVPVAGRWLNKNFVLPDKGQVSLPVTVTSQPQLEVPAEIRSQLVVKDLSGTEIFSGTAAQFNHFSFTRDGEYTARLVLQSQQDLGQSATAPTGSYTYDFAFTLHCSPTLTLSAHTAMQGSVIGVKLSGILGNVPPIIKTDLAPDAVFTRRGGHWICYLPVDYNQLGGEYLITATSGGLSVSDTVLVTGGKRRELDTSTLDGTAAIPYMGKSPNKISDLFQIADPDVYWNGAFTQPISGRVVRDYGVLEYTDRVLDPVLLATVPGLAEQNELIEPRASINVTMAVTPGRQVVAPAAGRVVFSGTTEGGRTIVIEHGCALKSIVYLLGSRKVSEGDYVAQGDVIGTTQGHVCCEMRLYDVPISPWEVWRGQGGLFFE